MSRAAILYDSRGFDAGKKIKGRKRHIATDTAGNVVIGEDRIRYAMEISAGDMFELQRELQVALGAAWDEELDPFRHESDDAPVVWLHKVG